MSTAMPHKIMLNISYNDEPITSSMILNTDDLLSALPETIFTENIIPKSEWSEHGCAGHIEQIESTITTLSMFIYVFGNATPCSKVNKHQFANVVVRQDKNPRIKFSEGIARNVAWSFFSLNSNVNDPLDKYFKDRNNQCLHFNFSFPIPAESQRIKCLQISIARHYPNLSTESVDATTQTKRHCQFTGGGDLLIESSDSLSTVVISEGTSSDEDEETSPVRVGMSKSTTLSIECKKGDHEHDKLKYQLFANMVIASVTRFVCNLPSFTDAELGILTSFGGYGIAYTGSGDVGCFKLIMKFGQPTEIITKLKLEQRDRLNAASRVDSLLDYCVNNICKLAK